MATIAELLQGGSPQYFQGGTGGGIALQGSAPHLQGSSPSLQVTANPIGLNPNLIIGGGGGTHASVPAPTAPAPTNPNGASAPVLPDRTNDINQNMAALDATGGMLSGGLGSIRDALSRLLGKYGGERDANEANYGDQSVQNKNNFLKSMQSAMLHAAQGRQGLFGVLASLGALNGSGVDLATRAVQSGANEDLSGANENFATNQSGLDTNIGMFRTADEQRRVEAEQARIDAEKGLTSEIAQKRQSIYGNLSNDYADMGNAEQAKHYSDLLASLFPEIATNAVPSAGPTYQAASYSPASLTSFLPGGTSIKATPTNGTSNLPGLSAYIAPAKRRLQ